VSSELPELLAINPNTKGRGAEMKKESMEAVLLDSFLTFLLTLQSWPLVEWHVSKLFESSLATNEDA
jgi:hypothetical protein